MVGWLVFGDALPDDYGNIGDAMLTLFVLLSLENLPTRRPPTASTLSTTAAWRCSAAFTGFGRQSRRWSAA